MQKIWYIVTDGKWEGPYSVNQLRCMQHLTPDTVVWREGMPTPLAIRQVPELKELFEDDEPLNPENEEQPGLKPSFSTPQGTDELALDYSSPPPMMLWLLLIAGILLFLVFRFIYE